MALSLDRAGRPTVYATAHGLQLWLIVVLSFGMSVTAGDRTFGPGAVIRLGQTLRVACGPIGRKMFFAR